MGSTEALAARGRIGQSQVIRDALEQIRISALGATILIALLGLLSGSPDPPLGSIVGVAAIGFLFHVFAFVLNDVVDLELDRTEPRRAAMPLVTGALTPRLALTVVAATVPLAAGLVIAVAPEATRGPALAALAGAFLGLAAYDVLGKRTALPPVTDVVQGLGWAALVACGAWVGGRTSPLTVALAGYVFTIILFGNGVHGPMRDLPNDHRHGVVTTATLLGARLGPGDRRIVTRRMLAYAGLMEAALIVISALALFLQLRWDAGFVAALTLTVVLRGGSLLVLREAFRGDAPAIDDEAFGAAANDTHMLAAGMVHLMIAFAGPIVLIAPSTSLPVIAGLVAVFLGPVLTHEWLAGAVRWCRTRGPALVRAAGRQAGDLVLLTRPHNCLAAGLAVILGAHLGGVQELGRETVVRAGLVAALIVAAANVENDREDLVEDRINYPSRPIAAGRVSLVSAGRLVAGLAALGIGLALTFGWPSGAVATAFAIASIAYSKWLKRVFLAGNLLVAGLGAATIAYGAFTIGQPTRAVVIGTVFVFLSLLSTEVLLSVIDRAGDAAAGRSTIGTRLSPVVGTRLVAGLLVSIIGVAALPTLAGIAPPAFAWASLVGIVAPNLLLLGRLLRTDGPPTEALAYPLSKVAWFSGLLALAFLV
jgi:4-hydroxybenzoate polyprenyltransferase